MGNWRKLGIIAAGGDLPLALAEHCASIGAPYFVARVRPFTDETRFVAHPGESHDLGEMGARIEALRQAGCDAIVFVGQAPRPDFATLRFDAIGMSMAPALAAAAGHGDDALLRALLHEHASHGFRVIGADEAMADLLAPAGPLGAHAPHEKARRDIERAARVVAAMGVWDIGQAAVVCDSLVLAVEAQEGTDEMLARAARLPLTVRGTSSARRGVLVKRPKPGQDRRVDLPVVGVRTIEAAANAGLAGVAIEAGAALLVRRAEIASAADAAGLFVYGFTSQEVDEA